jgi:hypothetical protein
MQSVGLNELKRILTRTIENGLGHVNMTAGCRFHDLIVQHEIVRDRAEFETSSDGVMLVSRRATALKHNDVLERTT